YASRLVRMGLLTEQTHSSATLRTRTLWSILGTSGFSVGVIAWPLTQPAPVVRGYLVSDAFYRAAPTGSGNDETPSVYPRDVHAEALSATQGGVALADAVVPTSLGDLTGTGSRQDAPARLDRVYDRIAYALTKSRPTHVTMIRYQSLDTIGHYFLRYAMPSEFGDVSEDEHRRFGPVLERQYGVLDEAVGRAMAALGPDDLLLVVSGYGMEPLGPGKRLMERLLGDPELSGTHDAAPDGF